MKVTKEQIKSKLSKKDYDVDSLIKGIDESIGMLKSFRKSYVKTIKQLIKLRKKV